MTTFRDLSFSCNCVGPQKGQPLCPCQMRGLIQRDGRWIRPEQDLGPVDDPHPLQPLQDAGQAWDADTMAGLEALGHREGQR